MSFGAHVHDAIRTIIKMPTEAPNLKPMVKKMLHETCLKGKEIAKWWEQVIGRRNIESFIDQVMRTESGKRITRVTFGL